MRQPFRDLSSDGLPFVESILFGTGLKGNHQENCLFLGTGLLLHIPMFTSLCASVFLLFLNLSASRQRFYRLVEDARKRLQHVPGSRVLRAKARPPSGPTVASAKRWGGSKTSWGRLTGSPNARNRLQRFHTSGLLGRGTLGLGKTPVHMHESEHWNLVWGGCQGEQGQKPGPSHANPIQPTRA